MNTALSIDDVYEHVPNYECRRTSAFDCIQDQVMVHMGTLLRIQYLMRFYLMQTCSKSVNNITSNLSEKRKVTTSVQTYIHN